ncbi:DEAD/DEAH box helicase family protein [Aurantiacibacter odishensis]|uniref:DEAD/DEAH box helicase family protein n=1 Tax=Aurantiacibacter odishensis TaxID=1155476 RepID=UPI0013C47233|nr:DEAD/DEAH box helicase family protein [Aurantiacibacter odishensis]
MRFSGTWRDYQARVLEEMDGYLDDGRLHIVAAPGSGKTVLGLEAMRRVGRPALVLSPSLTIRNQWADRLAPLFLPSLDSHRARISRDIAVPADMTIGTYQSLHAAYTRDSDFAALSALGPITLVLDECHHLRREWWSALFALRDRLEHVSVVALTATPPYDAAHAEWTRYESLCGPIDAEIGVPELVRNGDLAPHQDHVHFSQPDADIVEALIRRRDAVYALAARIGNDTDLPEMLLAHPFLSEPYQHQEAIFEAPEQLSAMLFYLASRGFALPQEPLAMLGVNREIVPDFNHIWLEPMLECLLHRKIAEWRLDEGRARAWKSALSEAGLITNHRVDFSESVDLARLLAGSTGKLHSVAEIARAESEVLGDALRMAVLTDHVRAAELPRDPDAPYAPSRLGVVPIFESLRRAGIDQPLGVLTGSLVIVPEAARQAAHVLAQECGIPAIALTFTALPGCPGYCKLDLAAAADRGRVALVTRLVGAGHIRVLVGTQALLGEGWDAPSINSLVLASNAASYMLSNQMRGRAIRTDPAAPDKVANIWHLATIDPADLDGEAGPDFSRLVRRFSMFDGVAEDGTTVIENGIDRLDLAMGQALDDRNALTMARARNRTGTARQWSKSLGAGTPRSQVREVAEVTGNVGSATLHVRNTLKTTAISSLGGAVLTAGLSVFGLGLVDTLVIGGGAALLYAAPGLYNSARLWVRNGTLEKRLGQVGEVLVEGLAHCGKLSREKNAYTVRVEEGLKGRHAITIEGGTRADQHRFVDAMMELLGPVQNPRYILRREGQSLGFRQLDYHAVPTPLGANKEEAELFCNLWTKRIGPARLIFTRSAHGRKVLLRARTKSMAAGLQSPVERRSMWL